MKIIVRKEKGLAFLYLALFGYFSLFEKKINIFRRKKHNKITKKAESYFRNYGLEPTIIDFFNLIFTRYKTKIGEETLGYISFLYDYPNKIKEVQNILQKEKKLQPNLFKKLKNQLLTALRLFEKSLERNSRFLNYLNRNIDKDLIKKRKHTKKIRKIIQEDLAFFGIKLGHINKIIISPYNYFPFQAHSIVYLFKDSIFIVSSEKFHPEVIEHEFLHSIINPLIKKIIDKKPSLTKHIRKLSSPYKNEFYKNNAITLLSEALIYSYINFKNKKPFTYKQFLKDLPFRNNKQFNNCFKSNTLFKKRCKILQISTFKDFIKKSKTYYSYFIEDPLTTKCYNLYELYFREKSKNQKLNFQRWLTRNITILLKK